MPSIGAKSFTFLDGQVNPLGERLQEITRPGVDGYAYRKIGKKAEPYTMSSVTEVTSLSAEETTVDGYKDIVGTLVTVEDERGNSHENQTVLAVQHVGTQPITSPSGGSYTNSVALIYCQWTLQDSGV